MRSHRRPAVWIAALSCALTLPLALAGAAPGAVLPPTGTLDLASDADGRVLGEAGGDDAGWGVAPAGDVNGDGRPDVIVGAPNADPRGRENAGSAYVLFGGASAGLPAELEDLGGRGFRIDGGAAGDRLGTAVSAGGDVDGDGFADVLVGAPRWADKGNEQDGSGAAFLVRGRAATDAVDLAEPSPTVTRFATTGARDQTGIALASTPDMDGDGRPELLIGAPRADAGGADAGSVFAVFSTRVHGAAVALEGDDVGLRLDGVPGSRAGLALDGIGDVDGDGRGDLAIGAPTFRTGSRLTGAGYVVFGRAATGRLALGAIGASGFPVRAATADGFLGQAVAGVGDVTGDGVPDIAFGAPASDRNQRPESGSAHVIAGKASPDPVDAADRAGFRLDGAAAGDRLGGSVAAVADVNADGKPEVAAGAPYADALSREDAGAVIVVFGGTGEREIDAASFGAGGFRIAGAAPNSRLWKLASPGDVNGDRASDLLVGSPNDRRDEDGKLRPGAVHVLLSLGPVAKTPDPGEQEEVDAGCVAADNVELLIDDSGSMESSDSQLLRRMAAELLITKPRNLGEVLGAYEFGSVGSQVFEPQVILPRGAGSNQPTLFDRLEREIGADNGGTNYNEAFTGVAKDNPGADARIFLTDGEHNEGRYVNGHRDGPPTYVIGLGIGRKGRAAQRLARIAEETGGRYHPGVTAQRLQPTLNRIDARLNCDFGLESETDVLTEDDPVESIDVPLDDDAYAYDVEIMWGDKGDDVEPRSLVLLDEDGDRVATLGRRALLRTIARPARTTRKGGLSARGHRRSTFFGLRLTGVKAARLRVRYRMTGFRGQGARVTAQLSESRRRR